MIAAGSLFTSCVENTEPQGIRDLREAKADYLASLSKLREADAEKVKAEAAYVQAQTETEKAEAAWQQALVEQQKLLNEALAKQNEEDAARIEASIENIKAQAAIDATKKQKALAEAQEELEKALKNIAAQSYELTDIERGVIGAYTRAYSDYIEAQKAVRGAEVKLYEATYDYKGENSVEAQKALYEGNKAYYEVSKAFFEAKLASNLEKAEDQIANYEEWVEEYEALKAEIAGFEYDKAEIQRDSALNEYENKAALDSFYAKVDAKAAAIATARGGFSFAKFEKALPVVSFKSGSGVVNVVETFQAYANAITDVTVGEDLKKITVAEEKGENGKKAIKNVVDSLNIIIDALNREKVVVDQIVKDTTGIGALVAKTIKDYNDTKAALEAGVDKYEGIAKAKAKVDSLTKVITDETNAFNGKKDAFITSAKAFVEAWNTFADKKTVKAADSENVFNAFVEVMKQRESIFPGPFKGDTLKYIYYKATVDEEAEKFIYKLDTLKFSELNFKDIKKYKQKDGDVYLVENLHSIFGKGFGVTFSQALSTAATEIKFDDFVETTNYFQNTFFNTYWLSITVKGKHEGDGNMYKTGDAENAYLGKAVAKAKSEKAVAETGIETAKKDFYVKVYSHFWGIVPAVESVTSTDSLKINYTEKTYTDPKVLVTFSGEDFFSHSAKSKDAATIDWSKVNYNDSSVALKAIVTQLGQNNIKIKKNDYTYTLYAKTLAVAQFASAAVNYKENTQALAELTKIVKDVETAYNNAVSAASAGSAKADSLMIALTGKKDGSNPIVNHNLAKGGFINVDGTFKLAGEQKTLAEKWVADYAKTWAELEKQKKAIAATTESHTKLAEIYNDYVKALSALEDKFAGNADQIYKAIVDKWEDVLEKIQIDIEKYQYQIELCEGNIAKLEAGYDGVQIAIESAQDELAKALAALEAAEAKLAAAEAAYEQVLANHGITE